MNMKIIKAILFLNILEMKFAKINKKISYHKYLYNYYK